MVYSEGFQDFDDEVVYGQAKEHTINPSTRNFVVEFDQNRSEIAFDVSSIDVQEICNQARTGGNTVRWM